MDQPALAFSMILKRERPIQAFYSSSVMAVWPSSSEDESHSHTDTSDDSLDLRTRPVSGLTRRNKRKLSEPRRVLTLPLPPKKARGGDTSSDTGERADARKTGTILNRKQRLLASYRDETEDRTSPLSDISDRTSPEQTVPSTSSASTSEKKYSPFRPWDHSPERPSGCDRICPSPSLSVSSSSPSSPLGSISPYYSLYSHLCAGNTSPSSSRTTHSFTSSSSKPPRAKQRNYKSMTRERRIEANARERNRVHTISAAFEQLRAALPTQGISGASAAKLSKLSVVRIASAYILTLGRLCGMDYTKDQSRPSINDCFELLSKSLHSEGKVKVPELCS
ncbi:unnamed protein product [Cyprideis torosa]|uniref:Uncharacterized protein n=1 Tax=Cyprideis torosa TaxID=163714 RepID=A0A7R8WD76_9CRUS|nr:unnamed protein product [Cyprideis torosa]CAG0888280.1 unnamed protein product [Cyprideis torosa]